MEREIKYTVHFTQDADDFLNDMRTIRVSCEIETDSFDNVVAVSRKVNSRLLKNILEMEIIIGLMKIDLINKVNKKTP